MVHNLGLGFNGDNEVVGAACWTRPGERYMVT